MLLDLFFLELEVIPSVFLALALLSEAVLLEMVLLEFTGLMSPVIAALPPGSSVYRARLFSSG